MTNPLTREHHKDYASLFAISWDAQCDCKEVEMDTMPLPLAIGQVEILLWTLANATPEHRELAYKKILAHDTALRAETKRLRQVIEKQQCSIEHLSGQHTIQANKCVDLTAQLAAMTRERDVRIKIQTDFQNHLADRDGNFYEQIKELIAHVDAITESLAASEARVRALEEAVKAVVVRLVKHLSPEDVNKVACLFVPTGVH